MGLPESPKEILASTIDYYHRTDGVIDRSYAGVSSCSLYLLNFLITSEKQNNLDQPSRSWMHHCEHRDSIVNILRC